MSVPMSVHFGYLWVAAGLALPAMLGTSAAMFFLGGQKRRRREPS